MERAGGARTGRHLLAPSSLSKRVVNALLAFVVNGSSKAHRIQLLSEPVIALIGSHQILWRLMDGALLALPTVISFLPVGRSGDSQRVAKRIAPPLVN